MEDGHRNSPSGMSSSFAIVGRATVVKPLSNVEMAVIRVTEVMITAVLDFDVTVSVLSRLCIENASRFCSLESLAEARELLGRLNEAAFDFVATASGG
jgi:hypothetical protein